MPPQKPARPCAHQLAGETVVRDLRRDLFNAIAAQEMAFFDSNRTGELINRLSTDTTLVGKAITNNLADGVRSLVQATVGSSGAVGIPSDGPGLTPRRGHRESRRSAAGVSMMVYISPKLALVMLSIVPPLAAGAIVYGRFVRNISRRTQDALSETTKVAEERFSNIRTVRAFAQERNEMARCAASHPACPHDAACLAHQPLSGPCRCTPSTGMRRGSWTCTGSPAAKRLSRAASTAPYGGEARLARGRTAVAC